MAWTQRGNDTFTDSNGTALEAHTPTSPGGASWDSLAGTGTLVITTNGVRQAVDAADFAIFSVTLDTDQALEFEVTGRGSQPCGVLRGALSGGNLTGYVARITATGAYLEKFTGSGAARSALANSTTTWLNGDTARMEVVGTTLSIYQNGSGTADVTTTDGTIAAGKAGLGGIADSPTDPMLDTWVVYDAPAAPTVTPPITHRTAITEPTLPTIGAAGSTWVDPSFGSRMARITDENTLPETGKSFTTPSSSHQNAWSKNATRLYVISSSGEKVPMTWDAATLQAARIGSLILSSAGADPQFSYLDDDIIYVAGANGSNHPVIQKYNFASPGYTNVLDLDTIATLSGPEIYCGGIYSTKTAPEQLAIIFGGASQDAHYLAAVFQPGNTSVCTVVDTVNSLIKVNGGSWVATNITLDFHLHHIQCSLDGTSATLETTGTDIANGKAPKYIWNLLTNTFAPVTVLAAAHSCFGYGTWINMDGPTEGLPDNRPYPQIRSIPSEIDSPRALIRDPFAPTAVYLDGHITFHHATGVAGEPIVMENYRSQDGPNDSPANTCAWKAWDDEIISIPTHGTGSATTVSRWCHFRSNVRADGDANSVQYFYYQPRPNVSPDGKWCVFTSNWEKTLGSELTTGISRHDVFIVEMAVLAARRRGRVGRGLGLRARVA